MLTEADRQEFLSYYMSAEGLEESQMSMEAQARVMAGVTPKEAFTIMQYRLEGQRASVAYKEESKNADAISKSFLKQYQSAVDGGPDACLGFLVHEAGLFCDSDYGALVPNPPAALAYLRRIGVDDISEQGERLQ